MIQGTAERCPNQWLVVVGGEDMLVGVCWNVQTSMHMLHTVCSALSMITPVTGTAACGCHNFVGHGVHFMPMCVELPVAV